MQHIDFHKAMFIKKHIFIIFVLIFTLSCRDENPKKEQQENTKAAAENIYKNAKIDIVIFNNDTIQQDIKYKGYGYAIYVYGSKLIYQPHKPGLPGDQGFKTREDAMRVAELVVHKMRNNIIPPTITLKELDSLGVLK